MDRAMHPKVIGGFTMIVFAFLIYQIGLNFKAYKFSWSCWDYMLISGCLGFIVAMGLVQTLSRRLDAALHHLRMNNALIISDDGIDALKARMQSQGRAIELWSGFLIGVVVLASFYWVFADMVVTSWHAWREGRLAGGGLALAEFGLFAAISVIAACIAGLFFGRLTRFGMLASVLSDDHKRLRVIPGHFDGACGLKPIGDFYLFQALLLAIPILWLAAWWAYIIPQFKDVVCPVTRQPQFLFAEWRGPFFVQWLIVLAYFYSGFARPVAKLRRRIRETRLALSQDEVPRLEREILNAQQQHSSDTETDEHILASDRAALRLWGIRNISDWPMDKVTLAKYQSLIGGEVLLPFGTLLFSRL